MGLSDFADTARKALRTVNVWPVEWAMHQEDLVRRDGTWCEFGVADGGTLNQIAAWRGDAKLFGFDSFKGLPEDWNERHLKGTFAREQPPMPPEGVMLVVGLFEDTLPYWHPPADRPMTFVHLDCDLYSGARTVLKHMQPILPSGCIMVIDDFFTQPFENGVLRALYESQQEGFGWEWLAACSSSDTIAIRVS